MLNCWSRDQKSVCFFDLRWWSVGCHQLLRSRWAYFPPALGHLPSVESRIAFTGKTSNSEDGVPKLRRGAEELKLRSAAISSAALLLSLDLAQPAAALETVTIRSCYDGDTCRTTDGERVRLACIDTPELRGKRAQPERAKAARDHLRAMVVGRSVALRRITTDRYGRTVGELFANGMNVQQAMVASRHAEIYWKYARQCPWTR